MPDFVQHILLTISAVMGIHLLDRLFLFRDIEGYLFKLVRDVREDITSQNRSLIASSKSLEAMNRSGIVQIYPSRVEAATDIKTDITSVDNSKVLIMGISLNDFVREMDKNLTQAWSILQGFAQGNMPIKDSEGGLDIRVLLIDPNCFGAKMRSESESQSSSSLLERLKDDVVAAANHLKTLEESTCNSSNGVRFSCRLYRLPPTLFLCWTDSVSYVQQYHFWSARDNRTPTPVLKYQDVAASADTYPYHKEMEHHFDWIWNNASVSVGQFIEGAEIGTDHGMKLASAANVYSEPRAAAARITYRLKQAKHRVSIQGISLGSFFKFGEFRQAISEILEKGEVVLEVLLLDPDSDQAKYRSFREHLFFSPNQSFEEYLRLEEHGKSELYSDTMKTISNIRQMIVDLKANKVAGWEPRLKLGLYNTAPSCFILRIDDSVFVEQYHYGKIVDGSAHAILGKDMPLFEYCQTVPNLYADEINPVRIPFDLLADHFMFAFKQARQINY